MKPAIILICILAGSLLHAQVKFDPEMLNNIAKGESVAFARRFTPAERETSSAYKVLWYRCFWNADPTVRAISGNVTVLFRPLQTGFDSLVLDMNQALNADSVKYHNTTVSTFTHASDQLVIRFSSPLPQNIPDSVTVYYHGVPPEDGFGTFEIATHGVSPVLWTLSEPYGASNWWPCKNGLTDKADSIDIYIRTSSAYKSASNGLLVSTSTAGGQSTYHWKHRYPIAAYLVCMAVTNFAEYHHSVPFGTTSLDVMNLVYPEDSATAVSQTTLIVPMIQLFDTLFGIYPFQEEKYGHAQFSWGGGMEHQTMTFVANFQFELIAHELGHMWFGDKVTCGSWTDIWLNEGFATFLSGLCYEHMLPQFWIPFKKDRIRKVTAQPGGSVYCTDTTDLNRIFDSRLSYAKGCMVLNQLRWVIGDEAFFTGVNNYLSDPALSYGFARTADLQSHLEAEYGRSLAWYFSDWYTGEGYPQYMVNWSQTGDTVDITLSQTQSLPTVPFFSLPVPLRLKNAVRDTMIRLGHTFSGELFKVRIPFAVDSVIFDPEYQLISANNTVNAVSEHYLMPALGVAPNPGSDHVTFSFGGLNTGIPGTLRIYDYSGRMKDMVNPATGAGELRLDTREYAPGMYFYVFTKDAVRCSGKFIISR